MRRLALAGTIAMMVGAIGGCGGASPSSSESAAYRAAEEAEAKARARVPREEQQRQRREEAATKKREAQEAAATAKSEAQEQREEARQRQEEESATESHSYPPAAREAFVKECDASSGHEDGTCECAIKRIEAKVPYGRFEENNQEVREGKPISFVYGFEIGYCATSSAISG